MFYLFYLAAPPLPKIFQKLQIPGEFVTSEKGENFMFYDSAIEDENRILVFGTHETTECFLADGTVVLADGTFSVVPKLFDQLYSIHISQNGVSLS